MAEKRRNKIKETGKTATKNNARLHKGGMPKVEVPPLDDLRRLSKQFLGNKTKVSEALGINRSTLRKWEKEDPTISDIFREQWGKRLDSYLDTAHILAMGVAEKDESGRMVYTTPPDPNMLRFMIEKYGRMEGFGDELTINANVDMKVGVPISKWITENSE